MSRAECHGPDMLIRKQAINLAFVSQNEDLKGKVERTKKAKGHGSTYNSCDSSKHGESPIAMFYRSQLSKWYAGRAYEQDFLNEAQVECHISKPAAEEVEWKVNIHLTKRQIAKTPFEFTATFSGFVLGWEEQ